MSACSSNSPTRCRWACISCLNMAGVIYAQCWSFTSKVFFSSLVSYPAQWRTSYSKKTFQLIDPSTVFNQNQKLMTGYEIITLMVAVLGDMVIFIIKNWVFPRNYFAQVVRHPDPTATRQLHFTTKQSQAVNTTSSVWKKTSHLFRKIPVLMTKRKVILKIQNIITIYCFIVYHGGLNELFHHYYGFKGTKLFICVMCWIYICTRFIHLKQLIN